MRRRPSGRSAGYHPPYTPCPLWQVRDAPAAKWAVAAGGKVKRAVVAEYASVQDHVRQVAG